MRLGDDRAQAVEDSESGLAALLDPVALEARLAEARVRRNAALAQRDTAEPAARPPAPAAPEIPVLAAPARPPQAAPRRSAGGRTALIAGLIFAFGLSFGAAVAVFVTKSDVRRSVALAIAPEIAAPGAAPSSEAPPVPAAAAPEVEVVVAVPEPVAAHPPAAPVREEPVAEEAIAMPAPPSIPAEEPEPSAPAAEPAAAVPVVVALPPRVYIHFPASAQAEAEAAQAALVAAGAGDVSIVPVRMAIGASNVRFYHDADRDGAARVADLVAPTLTTGRPQPRDFTDYTPPPLAGRVEIWLAGAPAGAAPRRSAPASVAQAPIASVPLPTPPVDRIETVPLAPPQDQAEAVARIIVERSLERLLRATPGP